MTAISVDLASINYADVGVVALRRDAARIIITPIDLPAAGLKGRPAAAPLARFLTTLAADLEATVIGLDGPQGWKSASNGYPHSRVCEARLRTQGKTGPPGVTKPANYLGFISFCIQMFDELGRLGWPRLPAHSTGSMPVAVETFPTSAWRALGVPPLPGKARSRGPEVEDWSSKLLGLGAIRLTDPLTHDQLQAAVSGLGLLALAERRRDGFEGVGDPPFEDGGTWFEGFIVNPLPNGCR